MLGEIPRADLLQDLPFQIRLSRAVPFLRRVRLGWPRIGERLEKLPGEIDLAEGAPWRVSVFQANAKAGLAHCLPVTGIQYSRKPVCAILFVATNKARVFHIVFSPLSLIISHWLHVQLVA